MTVGEGMLMMMMVAFLMVIVNLMMKKLPLIGNILTFSLRKELSFIKTQNDSSHFLIFFFLEYIQEMNKFIPFYTDIFRCASLYHGFNNVAGPMFFNYFIHQHEHIWPKTDQLIRRRK